MIKKLYKLVMIVLLIVMQPLLMQQQAIPELNPTIKIITSDQQEVIIPQLIARRSNMIAKTLQFNKDHGQPDKPIIFAPEDEIDKEKLDIAITFMQLLAQVDIKAVQQELDKYDLEGIITIGNIADSLQIPLLLQIIAKIIVQRVQPFYFINYHKILESLNILKVRPNLERLLVQHLLPAMMRYFAYQDPTMRNLSNPRVVDHRSHEKQVNIVLFSPDGKMLATASDDKTAKLWNASTGQLHATLAGHTRAIKTLAFSPDSKILATGSADATVKIWDVITGKLIHTFDNHAHGIKFVTFNHDGTMLATASSDIVNIWNIPSYDVLRKFSGYGKVQAIAFDPKNSNIIALGSGTINLWDIIPEKLIKTLTISSGKIIMFSPNGDALAITSMNETILFDMKTKYDLKKFPPATIVTFSPDSTILATSSWEPTAKLWNVATGKLIFTLSGHEKPIIALAFSPDSKVLATASWDKMVKLWDVSTGNVINSLYAPSEISTLAFGPKDNNLAAGSWNGTTKLWHFPIDELMQTTKKLSLAQTLLIVAAYQAAHDTTKLEIPEVGTLAAAYTALPALLKKIISPYIKFVSFVESEEKRKKIEEVMSSGFMKKKTSPYFFKAKK